MHLKGQKIALTGATSGIGRALLDAMVLQGATVIAVARPSDRLVALSHVKNVQTYEADLSKVAETKRVMKAIWNDHPDISIIVNNAAVQRTAKFLDDDFDPDGMEAELALNVLAPALITALSLPHMLRADTPTSIVNISSGLAFYPKSTSAIYCASKAALHSLTQSLRYQLAHTHVQVCEVLLPLVDTPMTYGRGAGKITASEAAAAILKGMEQGRDEIYVGKARILPLVMRVAPSLAKHILKNA